MQTALIYTAFFISLVFLWLLLLRAFIGFFGLDPFHPVARFIMRITDPLVQPFKFGPFLRPARIEPALWIPVIILFLLVSYTALLLFVEH